MHADEPPTKHWTTRDSTRENANKFIHMYYLLTKSFIHLGTDLGHGEVGVNESWAKLFIFRPLSSIEGVMGIGSKGHILLRKNDDELVSFDLGTQVIEEIGIKGSGLSQTLIYEKEKLFTYWKNK
ncbi:hypothetical protein HN51_053296 [Arachis hypogaea]